MYWCAIAGIEMNNWTIEQNSTPLGVVADIGGTNARFAMAVQDECGRVSAVAVRKLCTRDFPSFEAAYQNYLDWLEFRPVRGVFALAGPTNQDEVKLTNCPWVLRPSALKDRIGLDEVRLVNDFEAIACAVGAIDASEFRRLDESRDFDMCTDGVVSVVGPGSGLGVSALHRNNGESHVVPCEGGHVGFAPADEVDIHILRFLLTRYPRVSAERIVSGPGLAQIYIALAQLEGRAIVPPHAVELWEAALSGADPHARAALDRWVMLLGTVAGDIALAQGAKAVVLAGGILPRFGRSLDVALLLSRFRAKGRFETLMRDIQVALVEHPDPGLLGAASLLANSHDRTGRFA
jgi:glucokinase